jgi:DNA-binding transcriptional MerR regulator
MTDDPRPPSDPVLPAPLDPPDAALAAAVVDDEDAPYDLDDLAAEVGTSRTVLDAVARAGLLLPHHVDAAGVARYSAADVEAVRAGVTLLDAGLPLGELLDLARRTDAAVGEVAGHAVEAFLRFVRDPVRGSAASDVEAAERLVTAYRDMLPATERLVAHHLRRRLLAEAAGRIAAEQAEAEQAQAEQAQAEQAQAGWTDGDQADQAERAGAGGP